VGVQNAEHGRFHGHEHSPDWIMEYGIAKVKGEYLDSLQAATTIGNILQFCLGGNRVWARTAQKWVDRLGLIHERYGKGVYIDGHKRENVIFY
jgi:hypothetical protein